MDKILQIVQGWDRLGQFVFFCILLSVAVSLIVLPFKFLAILIRGYPKGNEESVDE